MFNLPLSPRCPAVADGGALAYNDSGVSTIKIKLVFVNIKGKRNKEDDDVLLVFVYRFIS